MSRANRGLERCDAEIAACTEYLMRGGPEEIGAYVGLVDWQREKRLIQQEECGMGAAYARECDMGQPALSLYDQFIATKRQAGADSGFRPNFMPMSMFQFQVALTDWAVRKGRAAIFADCGLGKTLMQLTWAENCVRHTNKPVLILTPLAVADQTVAEAEKFGIECRRSKDGQVKGSAHAVVTNYERLHRFDWSQFGAVVCDESSAIKNFDGERRKDVTEFMRRVPYRLLCTATAAPNDFTELGTSSEALGEMGHIDMLGRFFKNDQNTCDTKLLSRKPISQGGPISAGWRFKGHAEQHFWRWVCSWARACRKPSDLGFSDDGFVLPELIERDHVVEARTLAEGMLFPVAASNRREELEERRRTINERCEKAAELVNGTGQPAVIWCHLNDEGDLLEKLITDGRQIAGSTPDDEKEELFCAFATGQLKDLIIKDKIGAWGLNWQHCAHVVRFVTHSFESDYQAVRRCWRFGQLRPVVVDRIYTEGEVRVKDNLKRKALDAARMFGNLVTHMNDAAKVSTQEYTTKMEAPKWL